MLAEMHGWDANQVAAMTIDQQMVYLGGETSGKKTLTGEESQRYLAQWRRLQK